MSDEPTVHSIHFCTAEGEAIVTFTHDGKIVRGPGFPTDDAASIAFIEALEDRFPCYIAYLRGYVIAQAQQITILQHEISQLYQAYKARGLN